MINSLYRGSNKHKSLSAFLLYRSDFVLNLKMSKFPQDTLITFEKMNDYYTRVPSCTQQEENPPWTGVCWHVARPLWESETTNDQIWIVRVWLGATQVTPRVSHGTKFLVSKIFSYYPHMMSIYRNFWFVM